MTTEELIELVNRHVTHCVLQFQLVHPNAKPPLKGTAGSNAFDLYAAERHQNDSTGYWYNTGVAVAIPEGFVGLVFPRSSVYNKHLRLSNSVGVIDSDYRGEIKAYFDKLNPSSSLGVMSEFIDQQPFIYDVGDRICQLLIVPSPVFELEQVDTLPATARGSGGFGSTGNR